LVEPAQLASSKINSAEQFSKYPLVDPDNLIIGCNLLLINNIIRIHKKIEEGDLWIGSTNPQISPD
jgi:hypothetical protein